MKSKKTYFIVGLFSLLVITITLAVLVYLTGSPTASDPYFSRFKSVIGLDYGKPVYFEGYRIGQISSVQPEETLPIRFRVNYQVTAGWKIPADSRAVVQATGLLGDVSINIKAGKSPQFLSPGSEIPGEESVDLMAVITDLARDFEKLNKEKIVPLMDLLYERTDSLTKTLDEQIPVLLQKVNQATGQLNQLVDATGEVLNTENAQRINSLLANGQRFSEELKQAGDKLNALLAETHALVRENDPKVDAMMTQAVDTVGILSARLDTITSELESASMNLNELTDELRRDPSRLIFRPKDKRQDSEL